MPRGAGVAFVPPLYGVGLVAGWWVRPGTRPAVASLRQAGDRGVGRVSAPIGFGVVEDCDTRAARPLASMNLARLDGDGRELDKRLAS